MRHDKTESSPEYEMVFYIDCRWCKEYRLEKIGESGDWRCMCGWQASGHIFDECRKRIKTGNSHDPVFSG